jgi:peptidyl-prolyl cis-trans isomerase C
MRRDACRIVLFFVLTVASGLLAAGANKPEKTEPKQAAAKEPVVAQIGDYVLTLDKLELFWNKLPERSRAVFEQKGGKKAMLDQLIRMKLMDQEARRTGLAEKPDVRMDLEIAQDAVFYRAVYDEEVMNKVITEDAVRSYYDAHKDGFTTPEMIRCRHILVTPTEDKDLDNEKKDDAKTDQEAKAKIERLLAEIKKGADFAQLAREYSEDPASGRNGGDLGFFPKGRMVKPFDEAAFALQVGQVSDVVKTQYGYHIIKLEEKKPAEAQTLDQVRPRILQALQRDKKDELDKRFEALADELRKKYPVTVNESLLGEPPKSE